MLTQFLMYRTCDKKKDDKRKTIWILNKAPHQLLALSNGWVVEQSGTYLAQNLGRNIENIFCTFFTKVCHLFAVPVQVETSRALPQVPGVHIVMI